MLEVIKGKKKKQTSVVKKYQEHQTHLLRAIKKWHHIKCSEYIKKASYLL